jgi:hypothetical protein
MKPIQEKLPWISNQNKKKLFNNTWFVQRPKIPREADLGGPVLVHLICPEKMQMSNCQLPEYTLQNTKIHTIISYN